MTEAFREEAFQRAIYGKLEDVNDRLECYLEWCSTGEVGANYDIEPLTHKTGSLYNGAKQSSAELGYIDSDLSEEMERTEQAFKQIIGDSENL